MKPIKYLIFLFFTQFIVFAQDVILLKSGEEIFVKVLESNKSEIRFKKYDNLDGPDYILATSEINIIKIRKWIN